jgi:tetratricopeptide (TPR) repeat protein
MRLSAEPPSLPLVSSFVHESSVCFVAREPELAMLHASLAEVRGLFARTLDGALRPGPRIVLVHGESGIGKSALLARFASDVTASATALVLRGRCYERESTPYKVFDGVIADLVRYLKRLSPVATDELIDDLRAPLQQLFPAFARKFGSLRIDESERAGELSRGVDARPRAFLALRELLARIARHAPIVMTIDDLQWADLDSLPLLEALCAPSARLPLLLVGNYRRHEVETSPFLSSLLCPRALSPALCDIVQLALSPLAPSEAAALVAELAPLRTQSELVASARGIPFLLVEAALAQVHEPSGAASTDVGALFAARIAQLDDRAQALLAVLSVAARPLSIALATQAVVGLECGFDTVLELAARRLVRFRDLDGERCLEPYHDRVRLLVMARVDASHARALHLAIDAAMVRLDCDDPLRRVEHLRAAGQDARAAELAVRAAELSCAQLAWSQAADLFLAAIALCDHHESALHEKLAEVLSFAGRHAEAAASYMRAASASPADARATLTRLAAQQYVRAGQTAAGLALLDAALERVGVRLPRSQVWAGAALLHGRVKVLLTQSLSREAEADDTDPASTAARTERMATLQVFQRELWLSHPVQSALAHALYCSEAMRAGPRVRIHALAAEVALLAVADGPRARAVIARLVARAEALTHEHGGAYEVAILCFCRALASIHTDWRPRAAIVPLERADKLLREECAGTQFERAWVAMALDHVLEITGQLHKLGDTVRAREREASGPDDNTRALRIVSVPLVLLMEDRPREALAMVNARSSTRREPLPLLDYIAVGRGVAAFLYQGAANEAHEYLESERGKLGFQLAFRGSAVAADLSFTRARNAAARYWITRERSLRREVEQRVRRAQKLPPLARAHFRLIEASVARCDGRLADARSLLRSARVELDQAEGGLAAWCARYREAQLEGSSELLATADGWFREQGVQRPENWVSLGIPGLHAWG